MSQFVPYLAKETIERDAAVLLAEFEHAKGVTIEPPIPVEDIVEKYLKLRIEFDDMHVRHNVPRPANGETDILGAIYGDGSIFIDESLDPEENPAKEGRYRFTLAHEGGGHWRLHQHLITQDTTQTSLLDEAVKPKFICRLSRAKAREEWQADFYASCLLMPRKMVFAAWAYNFGSMDAFVFDRRRAHPAFRYSRSNWISVGEAWSRACGVPSEPSCDDCFNRIAWEFAHQFRVSTEAMRIRLEELGLLIRETPRQASMAFRH